MSLNGIKTSFWGPHAWAFLFSAIAGAYPTSLNKNNKDHVKIFKSFVTLFSSLQQTLPCKHCRDSYRKFYKEIPIEQYNHSRVQMMKWLYLIHDKVNKKLIAQQKEAFELAKKELMSKNISSIKMKAELKKIKTKLMITKPSPPFDKILVMYESHRA